MSNYFIEHIINFAPINERIATSGQPERSVFPLINAAGYQMVIYLAVYESPNHIAEEPQIVRDLGMEFIHIPVIWTSPRPEQFDQLASILEENKGKNIFIHCELNYRVSSFLFLYKVLYLNSDPESAWWSMLEIWEPDATWRALMREVLSRHDAAPFERLEEPEL